MATMHKKADTRAPLRARPDAGADAQAIAADFARRFPKTLEYLGR